MDAFIFAEDIPTYPSSSVAEHYDQHDIGHRAEDEGQVRGNSSDLELHRETIYQLYIRENRALKDIIKILKSEGCTASRNMYLNKLKAWGFKKNINHKAMGSFLTGDQVQQNSFRIHKVTRLSGPNLNPRIRRDPQIAMVSTANQDFQYLRPSLKAPDPWWSIEKFFSAVQQSHMSVLEPSLSYRTSNDRPNAILQQAQDKPNMESTSIAYFNGVEMINNGRIKAGGAWIDRGFQQMKICLQEPTPDMVFKLLMMIITLQVELHGQKVAEMIVGYLYQLILIVRGQNDPLTALAYTLTRNWSQIDVLKTGIHLCTDYITQILDKSDQLSITTRIVSLRWKWDMGLALEQEYEELIRDSQYIYLQESRERYGYITRLNYADYARSLGNVSKAVSILSEISDQMLTSHSFNAMVNSIKLAAYLMEDASERYTPDCPEYKEAYQRGVFYITNASQRAEVHGKDSHIYVLCQSSMARYRETWGSSMEAEEKYEEVNQLLGEIKIES